MRQKRLQSSSEGRHFSSPFCEGPHPDPRMSTRSSDSQMMCRAPQPSDRSVRTVGPLSGFIVFPALRSFDSQGALLFATSICPMILSRPLKAENDALADITKMIEESRGESSSLKRSSNG